MKKIFLALSAVLLLTQPVFAHDGPCKADIEKFCKDVKVGGGAVIKCLKAHDAELSTSCKAHGEEMKGKMKTMMEACHADKEKLCPKTEKGKATMQCMREHREQVTDGCKAAMKDMHGGHKGHE